MGDRNRVTLLLVGIAAAVGAITLIHWGIRVGKPFFGEAESIYGALARYSTVAGGAIGIWLLYERTRHSDKSARIAEENARIAAENARTSIDSLRLAQRAELAQRYAAALEMLGSSKESVQLAGITQVRDAALEAPDLYFASTVEILAVFAREKCADTLEKTSSLNDGQTQELFDTCRSPETVVNAVRAIGEIRKWLSSAKGQESYHQAKIIFSGLILSHCRFEQLDLSQVEFSDCHFCHVTFYGCDFRNVDVVGTLYAPAVGAASLRFQECELRASRLILSRLGIPAERGRDVFVGKSDLQDSTFESLGTQVKVWVSCVDGFTGPEIELSTSWHFGSLPQINLKGHNETAFNARTSGRTTNFSKLGMPLYVRVTDGND